MNIWIPTKQQIENILEDTLNKLKTAQRVSDIQQGLEDELCELECHISNRANIELGKLEEAP